MIKTNKPTHIIYLHQKNYKWFLEKTEYGWSMRRQVWLYSYQDGKHYRIMFRRFNLRFHSILSEFSRLSIYGKKTKNVTCIVDFHQICGSFYGSGTPYIGPAKIKWKRLRNVPIT